MELKTNYLGLELNNPIIAASSPLTASLKGLVELEKAGVGAIVLKSIFEEQITDEVSLLDSYSSYPEAQDYLRGYVQEEQIEGHLRLIREAKRVIKVPIIASINCRSTGRWVEYAKSIESAGADALELNIFILPTSAKESTQQIEERYFDIVGGVVQALTIPVSVKISMHFTNISSICSGLYNRGAKGVVMFNRFFKPDIDIDSIEMVASDPLSSPSEMRNVLRMVGICSPQVPKLDIVASTGIHSGEEVIKALLSGAVAVQVCSTLYLNGLSVVEQMKSFVKEWMDTNSFDSISSFRGLLSYKNSSREELYQRVQYMKFFPNDYRSRR